MQGVTVQVGVSRRVLNGAAWCALGAVATVVWCAASVVLCHAQAPLRDFFDFGFAGVPQHPSQVLSIAVHNAQFAAAPLIAAALCGVLRRVRIGVDILLAALLLTNSALIGLAIGAHGPRMIAALAIHAPLEYAAFALAGGTYLAAFRALLPARALAASAIGCAVLLLVAAGAETYLPPGTL